MFYHLFDKIYMYNQPLLMKHVVYQLIIKGILKIIAPAGRCHVRLGSEIHYEVIAYGLLLGETAVMGEESHAAKLYFSHIMLELKIL